MSPQYVPFSTPSVDPTHAAYLALPKCKDTELSRTRPRTPKHYELGWFPRQMYCPQCSEEQVSEEMRFCSRCGLPLAIVSQLVRGGGALEGGAQGLDAGGRERSDRARVTRQALQIWGGQLRSPGDGGSSCSSPVRPLAQRRCLGQSPNRACQSGEIPDRHDPFSVPARG